MSRDLGDGRPVATETFGLGQGDAVYGFGETFLGLPFARPLVLEFPHDWWTRDRVRSRGGSRPPTAWIRCRCICGRERWCRWDR